MESVPGAGDEAAASEEVPKMRIKRWVYLTLGTVAWLAPLAAAAVQIVFPEFRGVIPEDFLAALSMQALALLTYPAGMAGLLAALPALYFGIVTPMESLLISGPVSLAAGYLQWFVVIPRLFGRPGSPPPAQKSPGEGSRLAAAP
jgi:hypothetical protein